MKKSSFNLNNKNILITGGSGFLGSQIVDAFINEQSKVYIIDVKKPKKKNSTKYFRSDITNEEDLKIILNYFKKKKLRIDVLINNAAIDYSPKKSKNNNLRLENFSNDLWEKDRSVSLKGS